MVSTNSLVTVMVLSSIVPMMLTRVLDAVGRDGFVHAFFNPAVTYLGCHRRVYGIDACVC
jgi:hypothetical protein